MSSLYQVNAGDRILAVDNIQFYNLLKGVAASGENILLIYNAGALTLQPSSDPSAGTRVLTIKNNAGTTLFAARYDGLLEMLAAAAAPGSPVAGSVYWDTLLAALRVYDGTNWLPVGLTSGMWDWYWAPNLQILTAATGTGAWSAVAASVQTAASLATGATSGSTLYARIAPAMLVSGTLAVGKLRRWAFTANFVNVDANTSAYMYMTNESVTTAPSGTVRHFGIKTLAGVVYFTTADGTTEQTTDISAFVTQNTDYLFTVLFDGTTATLYINGTLRATHATKVPDTTAATPVMHTFITNSAAANKTLYIGRQSAVFAT